MMTMHIESLYQLWSGGWQQCHLFTGVASIETLPQVGIMDSDAVQLIAKGEPVWLAVVLPTKQLDFGCPRRNSFDDSIHLIRFVASGPDFGNNSVTVYSLIDILRFAFHSN